MLDRTTTVIPVEEGEIVEVRRDGAAFTDFEGNAAAPRADRGGLGRRRAPRSAGFDDFMLKEIHEQPDAIRDTLAGRVVGGRLTLDELHVSDDVLREVNKVFVVACGTAFHSGLVAKYAIEHWTRLPVEIEIAQRVPLPRPGPRARHAHPGRQPERARRSTRWRPHVTRGAQGSQVIAVTNTVGSSLAREADGVLYTHAGPEICVAGTKTFATQMVSQYLVALYLAQVRGTMFPEEIARGPGAHGRAPRPGRSAPSGSTRGAARSPSGSTDAPDVLFIGRHTGYPAALEGALKLKELSYIHAEGFPAGELKHGPIALIEEGVPVVAVATACHVYPKMLSNIQEVRARGAVVIAVATEGDDQIGGARRPRARGAGHARAARRRSLVDGAAPAARVPRGELRGCDVDQPRNLAKSVTVE